MCVAWPCHDHYLFLLYVFVVAVVAAFVCYRALLVLFVVLLLVCYCWLVDVILVFILFTIRVSAVWWCSVGVVRAISVLVCLFFVCLFFLCLRSLFFAFCLWFSACISHS